MLLYGSRDPIAPAAHAHAFQRAVPHSTLTILPGLSHLTLILNQRACNQAAAWLRQTLELAHLQGR
jgi:pimeloyl-ACP methyl ester carboxylesterase